MSGLVSIITPSYNTAAYIGDTIRSVLAQTYQEWEMIIVDDCSTDNTEAVVASFGDSRIRYLKNAKNSGAAVSRNYALREARGKWIAFLDSDDLWEPEKLEKQIRFMEEHGYQFTCTDYRITLPDGTESPYIYTAPSHITKRMLYRYCYFSTITVMYDREAIGLIQIADIKKNNDYAMWFKVIEKADCYRLPESLSCYRKREGSISSGSKLKLIKHHYILYRKALGKSPVVSVLLTVYNLFWGILKKIFNKKRISN
ncbi:glycosyltransferase family 2 protein [Pseudoflavonifractor phocaeensis]|uniref:glycosyltransferase family 2 protein n=1 Tax=Pseudoflavonifractor phocaeensis TaxID=1870988 RepID=UPI001F215FD2|nr:glycosyltransferase family 2 protein [Pseudoflavonifractor phocaeensis]MCF2661521.1 glycosyltransferase family 2 protein [Pseudoflavonifractor phocaeensis]